MAGAIDRLETYKAALARMETCVAEAVSELEETKIPAASSSADQASIPLSNLQQHFDGIATRLRRTEEIVRSVEAETSADLAALEQWTRAMTEAGQRLANAVGGAV